MQNVNMKSPSKPVTSSTSSSHKTMLPGDIISIDELQNDASSVVNVKLGPGLQRMEKDALVTKCGIYHATKGATSRYWINGTQKRYIPSLNEPVIGTVISSPGEFYKIDIGGPHMATMSRMAFEGATKKNRPNLATGTSVYCRVSLANKDMEPELECIAPSGKAEGYGELKGGFVFSCSLSLARSLLLADCPVLTALGKRYPFEIAVGMNGRIWVNSASTNLTILIVNVIKTSETDSDIEGTIAKLISNDAMDLTTA